MQTVSIEHEILESIDDYYDKSQNPVKAIIVGRIEFGLLHHSNCFIHKGGAYYFRVSTDARAMVIPTYDATRMQPAHEIKGVGSEGFFPLSKFCDVVAMLREKHLACFNNKEPEFALYPLRWEKHIRENHFKDGGFIGPVQCVPSPRAKYMTVGNAV